MHLYLDDSGTRHPNRNANIAAGDRDWFALGGVLIRQEDEPDVRRHHAALMEAWNLDPDLAFLHSYEIRHHRDNFSWLNVDPAKCVAFMQDLTRFLVDSPLCGIACVIDRPGYNHRYRERYGRQQWNLCQTAFSVVVERAAKYAQRQGYRLKVFVERADKKTDNWMRGYYDHLRTNGMPFDAGNMQRYQPLSSEELHHLLYEFRLKAKSSPIMQAADLYLWPMCMAGYDPQNRPFQTLLQAGRLIDCMLSAEEIKFLGIKYSCFELVQRPV